MTTTTTTNTEIKRQRDNARDRIAQLNTEITVWETAKNPASGLRWDARDDRTLAELRSNLSYWQGRRDGLNEALAQLGGEGRRTGTRPCPECGAAIPPGEFTVCDACYLRGGR